MDERRINAAKQGAKTYDGHACKHCGTNRRYTLTGQCSHCIIERSKISAKKRTEKIRVLMQYAAEKDVKCI